MKVKKIYYDMDGVLADFDRGIIELCGLEPYSQNEKWDPSFAERDDRMWAAIRDAGHFYDRLELLPGAEEMFRRVWAKYGKRCEILTGIPRASRGIVTAGDDKKAWTARLLSDEVKVNLVLRKEKQNYCTGEDCVLIDDRVKTIEEWKEAGGTGILHKDAETTLKKLEAMGLLSGE